MPSASGISVAAIARLVAAHEDTVRDVIHALTSEGWPCWTPQWAGGRPRLISHDDIEFIVATATTRPTKLGRPFTRWSVQAGPLPGQQPVRRVHIGRERLSQILGEQEITSSAPAPGNKEVTRRFPGRCFAFDQFGLLSIRPRHGAGWARHTKPDRLPTAYTRTHGIRYFPWLVLPWDHPLRKGTITCPFA